MITIVGFIILCSTQNQKNTYTTDTDTDHRGNNNPCRHSILHRKQIQGIHDYNAYKNRICNHGFKAMDHNQDRKGSECINCGAIFCGNPGCGCAR